jgi:uncharacterized protein
MLNDFLQWESLFHAKAKTLYPPSDPSHDYLHVCRVVNMAVKLAAEEGADIGVVLPAAFFHDCVNVPKNDPRRKEASHLSAEAAVDYLGSVNYPSTYFDRIKHAIIAHSFSANIPAETIEAKVVQDADRLDGLGAIGVARCFSVSALLGVPYYCEGDALAERRAPDDRLYTVDHFFVKLFRVAESLQTAAARTEGQRRVLFMKSFLTQLQSEILAEAP